MVNMNGANGKENERNEVNGISQDDTGAIARSSEKENKGVHPLLKSNSPPVEDTVTVNDRITISNGVNGKLNSVSLSSSSDHENVDASSSKNLNTVLAQSENGNNIQGAGYCGELRQDVALKNESSRPNSQKQLKQREQPACNYDENSSSEDEECCIYTYKGDSNQMADLPSSFFRLDLMSARPNGTSGNSSPDMDYLEMDFDPGPSNDRDSSSSSGCCELRTEEDFLTVDVASVPLSLENCEAATEPVLELEVKPPTPLSPLSTPSPVWNTRPQISPSQPSTSGMVWSPPISPDVQTMNCEVVPMGSSQQSGITTSPCFCLQPSTLSQHSVTIDENFNDGDTGSMIWKEEEAKEKQVNQIGTSLCGATAVINALLALNVPYSTNAVKQALATRLRNESAEIPEYLLSRCNAGVTHVEMINALQTLSQDTVYARFFHMYPQRSVSVTSWLSHWIKKGAVPILTLNLQRNGSTEIADCWHHQTAYGVSSRGVYLTNPMETQSEAQLRPQLSSPSVLLIRRHDILSRWTPDTALHRLASPALPFWRHLNVLGQVVNVIREGKGSNQSVQHVTIPASYSSGVTLAILRTNPACDELRLASELPVDLHPPT